MREKSVEGEIYHLCNKSIAGFSIFKDPKNAKRFIETLDYYNSVNHPRRFSYLRRKKGSYTYQNLLIPKVNALVKFLCYCIMLDHYHVLLKVLNGSLSKFINDIEISFSRYFNVKFNRKGPLWQSRFRLVRVKTNEQLLHVSRYIHLNPTTAGLVDKPEDWELSSYRDYINDEKILKEMMTEITIKNPRTYKKFVEDRKDYQKKLAIIKGKLLE